MKRSILLLAAFFTFSTALTSCRDEERRTDEVEIETTMDDDINTNNDGLNGTTRGGNMDNTTETDGTTTTGGNNTGTTTGGTTTGGGTTGGNNTTGGTTGGTTNP